MLFLANVEESDFTGCPKFFFGSWRLFFAPKGKLVRSFEEMFQTLRQIQLPNLNNGKSSHHGNL